MLVFFWVLASWVINPFFISVVIVAGFINGRYKPALILGFIFYALAGLFIGRLSLIPAVLFGIFGAACSAFGAWLRLWLAKWTRKSNKPLVTQGHKKNNTLLTFILTLIAALALLTGYLKLPDLDFPIGERAMGGYDGASSISPEALLKAEKEARDASDNLDASIRGQQDKE